jgi:predicted type IV restriction endonuclease
MANFDFEICDGKSFKDLCKDIITRSDSKKDQLDTLISDVRTLIKNANDAQVFLPRIKEFMDVGIKNDEQLVKLASVAQRLQSSQIEVSGGDTMGLSEEEKEELMKNAAKNEIVEIKKEVESIVVSSLSSQ